MVRFTRCLQVFERLPSLVAFCFGACRMMQELQIAMTGKEPTRFTMAEFSERYDQQPRVRVTGRVAVDHKSVSKSRQAYTGGDLAPVTATDRVLANRSMCWPLSARYRQRV